MLKKIVLLFLCTLLSCPLLSQETLAATYKRIATTPGSPLFILYEMEDGRIRKALLRSPSGINELKMLRGAIPLGQSYARPRVDGDMERDLIWRLDFLPEKKGKTFQLWITSVTASSRAWISTAPTGRTLWEKLPLKFKVPEDILIYISPTLPSYSGIGLPENRDSLTFIYTIGLTNDGPKFVIAPEVYKQLSKIASLVREAETDPARKLAYRYLNEDFEALSRGRRPSQESIENFAWNQTLNLSW